MDGFIIFITEAKLYLAKKKDELLDKWDNMLIIFDSIKDSCRGFYNKKCKNTVDKVIKYLDNLFFDLDDSLSFLYDYIWDRCDGRFPGYVICALLSFALMLLLGSLVMAGLPEPLLLGCLLPISLVPIDIVVTTSLFIHKRFKRAYNNSLKRMKKEYGVRNNKDLVEAYKAKKQASEAKQQVMNQRKTETKKVVRVKNDQIVQNNHMLTDSEFLEKMFGYVSCSKYVSEENREKFLDEINAVLNKYAKLKRITPGDVNGDLRSDVEHLQSEYSRYISNQEKKNNNEDGYSMGLRK